MKKLVLAVALTALFTSCAQIGVVTNAPSGSMAKGTIQVQLMDGKVKTMDKTNLFVKEDKIRQKYTVKIRGNKIVKIVNKGSEQKKK